MKQNRLISRYLFWRCVIAKGQKRIQDQAETRSSQQYQDAQAAKQRLLDNPELKARRLRVADRRKAIDSGTIADAKDFISNRAAVAERERSREARSNITDTGVAGLAANYANPTQIALAKQLNKDEFARDSAAQTETDAQNYMNETDAMERDIISTDLGINSGIMGTSFGVSQNNQQLAAQIAAQRASIVPGIIGAAIGGATGILTQSNWFNRGSGAARGVQG